MLEISTRLENIDHQVHQAMRAVDVEKSASSRTKETLHRLCEKSESILERLNKDDTDPDLLMQEVMSLEELGDEAKAAVQDDHEKRVIGDYSFQCVIDAHNMVSQLKSEVSETAKHR